MLNVLLEMDKIVSDSKVFLNDDSFKVSPKNDPRIFSNTVNIVMDQNMKVSVYFILMV